MMDDEEREDGNQKGILEQTVDQEVVKPAFKGAILNLKELRRQDGLIAESLDKSMHTQRGVVQTFISAIEGDDNPRQIFRLARWKTQRQADLYVKAFNTCRIVGAVYAAKLILDLVNANAAGENATLMHEAGEILSHTTITTRQEMERKQRRNGGPSKGSSILT